MAGLYTDNTNTTLAQIQTLLNGLYIPGNATFPPGGFYETKIAGQSTGQGYTNVAFPTANGDGSTLAVQNVSYYDNYDFDDGVVGDDYSYAGQGITGEGSEARAVGLATGGKSLILGTSNWLYSYVFYDIYNRTIQVRSNNQLSSAKDNLTTIVYDPTTRLAKVTKTYHNVGGGNQFTIVKTPTYDPKGRLTQINQSINSSANQLVAQYQYNELGQVVAKQLHNTGGANFIQTVDLRYNIRGWLTSINNAELANDGGLTNSDTNDYFGMELLYNTNETSGLGNTPAYNGNVSAMKWKGAGDASSATAGERSYNFSYDKNDQLISAVFQKYGTTAWDQAKNTLNEMISYDHNGSIVALQRHQNNHLLQGATVINKSLTIDSLFYTYANGNQLSSVSDASGNTAGFNDGATATTEYTYDNHGNLTGDQNKGISAIIYNTLGKAQQITFTNGNVVAYTYDASGNKLTMASTVSGTTTTTSYVNGFVYNTVSTTNTLNFFSSPEGRVIKNTSGAYEYQYAITDHLGNTRVLFTSAAPVAQGVTATFETNNQTTEATEFDNYGHISAVDNHTPGGSNSQYLNGGYAGIIGVAKSYKVYPGDQLKIEAYGSYNPPTTNSTSIASFASILLGAFNLPTPAQGEFGTPSAGINAWANANAFLGYGDGTTDTSDPKAFVNIVLFDKNYNYIDVAYAQLKGTSLYYMTQSYTVKREAGYAYLYVSNEQTGQTDVYFDDVTMTYTPSNILQSSEYYPFGLQTSNSWTRDNTTNNFLYDGGSEVNTTTGYYDLPYRNYDPALGRFFQVDPLDYKNSDLTPYHYSMNNPITYIDPSGALEDYEGPEKSTSSNGEEEYNSSWTEDEAGGEGGGGGSEGNPASNSSSTIDVHWSVDNGDGTTTYGVTGPDGQGYVVTIDGCGTVVSAGNADAYDGGNTTSSSGSFMTTTGNGTATGVSWSTADGQMSVTVSNGQIDEGGTSISGGTISSVSTTMQASSSASGSGSNTNFWSLFVNIFDPAVNEGASEAAQLGTFTKGATNIAKGAGATLTAVNAGLTVYTIKQEYNQGKIDTHSFVNGGVAAVTTLAAGATLIIGAATAPIWLTAIGIGGAAYGLVYGIDQLSGGVIGIDQGIDNSTNHWGAQFNK